LRNRVGRLGRHATVTSVAEEALSIEMRENELESL
jgi:hypothetical protein